MKKALFTTALLAAATAAMADIAVPEVSDVTIRQSAETRRVTVTYTLANAPAIVIVDICTNGVSIGDANLHYFTGDCNKVVQPGANKRVSWQSDLSWPGHEIVGNDVTAKVYAWALDNPPDYMVADLTAQNAVNYYTSTNALPDGGLTNDVYRTDRIVMRRIHAAGATFTMGANELASSHAKYASERTHQAQLDHDYWMGVFEFTQGQNTAIGGPSISGLWGTDGSVRPIVDVTFNKIRESSGDSANSTYRCPANPAPSSILGKLNARTGLAFDLPGEAEWEYACRAGTTSGQWNDGSAIESTALDDSSRYNCSSANLANLGRYMLDGGMYQYKTWYASTWDWSVDTDSATAKVGSYLPNSWGLYDMHGNACEICLDYYKEDITGDNGAINTTANETESHVARGGGYAACALECRSAYRMNLRAGRAAGDSASGLLGYSSSEIRGHQYGFRVVCPIGE